MIQFICLFFPAIISLFVYEKLCKCKLSVKESISVYSILNLAVNGSCFLIKSIILNTGNLPLNNHLSDMTPSIAFNYILISVPLAIIYAFIASLISKNVALQKKETKDEEKNDI